jgi:hypothetical protein
MRYLVTRMNEDKSVSPRYRRSGWMAFDTQHKQHGAVWPTHKEAKAEALRMERAALGVSHD